MKIVAEYKGDEILLKNFNSYLELDRVLSSFESKEDLIRKLNLDEETDNIYVLDNNGKIIDYNPKMLRAVASFYEQGKGEEFVDWIFSGTYDEKYGWSNKGRLKRYFLERQSEFTKDKSEDEFDIGTINNREGKRLYSLIRRIKDNLVTFDVIPSTFRTFRYEIIPDLLEYVKRNGTLDYAYMRKFANTLAVDYFYSLGEPNIKINEINKDVQKSTVNSFKNTIYNYLYNKNQSKIDELTIEKNGSKDVIYDVDGIKIDEKEFLEEFDIKKRHM